MENNPPVSPLLALPTELLTQICLHLPHPRDVKLLSSTCRTLRDSLTITNQYLWYTLLKTLPHQRYHPRSFYYTYQRLPPPSTATRKKAFDFRVNYFGLVCSILMGRMSGCFDCLNLNSKQAVDCIMGGIFYRRFCVGCGERWLVPIRVLQIYWPEVEIPPTLLLGNERSGTVHYHDAMFLIKDQLSPEARSHEGRFLSMWTHFVKIRRQDRTLKKDLWASIDPTILSGAAPARLLKMAGDIYVTDQRFKKYHILKDKDQFLAYLAHQLVGVMSTLSELRLDLMRDMKDDVVGLPAGERIFITCEEIMADNEYEYGTTAERQARKWGRGIWDTKSKEMMGRIFGLHATGVMRHTSMVSNWLDEYKTRRIPDKAKGENDYSPFKCGFCTDETPEEREVWDGSWAGAFRKNAFQTMSGLVEHVFIRHYDKFEGEWKPGGRIFEKMAPREETVWISLTQF